MNTGSITVDKQLAYSYDRSKGIFGSPKNGKARTITPATSVLAALKKQKVRQLEQRMKAGALWNNPLNLVFTHEDGSIMEQWKLKALFNKLLKDAGLTGVRFHDLRHTFAVNSIRAGDDIKTIQGNLGHSSAAFTLDRYGHFTEQMKQDSAVRMEDFIKSVLNL